MAADLNLVVVSGRVGSDPEVKEVGDTELATFSLANDRFAGSGKDAVTQWFRVQVWGARAKVADYIKKGMKLTVQGRIEINKWENDDGEERTDVRINADHIELPPKSGSDDDDDRPARRNKSSNNGRGGSSKGGKSSTKKKTPF